MVLKVPLFQSALVHFRCQDKLLTVFSKIEDRIVHYIPLSVSITCVHLRIYHLTAQEPGYRYNRDVGLQIHTVFVYLTLTGSDVTAE